MSTEQKTPSKASGAAWSEAEKFAYLLILGDLDGKMETKVTKAPLPAGRSIISCQRFLGRLRDKYGDDIEKIKHGQPIVATDTDTNGSNGTVNASPEKAKTPRKRKVKVRTFESSGEADAEGSPPKKGTGLKKTNVVKSEDAAEANDDLDASPKKKAGGRKKKSDAVVKEEEDTEDEIMKDASS
ncbi:hypothetical protein IQ07DRAFT_635901 [Pyrenochaeta sp. DS3sAY3a]|nr:hypothetical protein IQ07DRAFT_635901 [Pyrenochaeta sp. DS3sAY3a]